MFKIGEKVVYKTIIKAVNPHCVAPSDNETVTIYDFAISPSGLHCAFVKEYLYTKDGGFNAIDLRNLHKLDHTFAEEVTARIEEEINQENLIEA